MKEITELSSLLHSSKCRRGYISPRRLTCRTCSDMSLSHECEHFLSPPFSFQVSVRACRLRYITYNMSPWYERSLSQIRGKIDDVQEHCRDKTSKNKDGNLEFTASIVAYVSWMMMILTGYACFFPYLTYSNFIYLSRFSLYHID